MRLILIRHGDPDYSVDSLTEKGWREAALLAKRAKDWQIDDAFVSPLGRARDTARACLKAWGKEEKILDWAQEFYFSIDDGKRGKRIPWDFYPSEWTGEDKNFCENEWVNAPNMLGLKKEYERVCASLDEFLQSYSYFREGRRYRKEPGSQKTVVIFCHFGIGMVFLSHLLNISTQALLHGFFLAPTSVTVLSTEERHGDEAYFRCERLGDTLHLKEGNERVSASGYFAEIFQEIKE